MDMQKAGAISSILVIAMFSVTPAYAYLDAGTGSMILQLLLGGLAGLAVVGKLYWSNTKEFFRRLFGRRATPRTE
jgi:hypothetical protein